MKGIDVGMQTGTPTMGIGQVSDDTPACGAMTANGDIIKFCTMGKGHHGPHRDDVDIKGNLLCK